MTSQHSGAALLRVNNTLAQFKLKVTNINSTLAMSEILPQVKSFVKAIPENVYNLLRTQLYGSTRNCKIMHSV